MGKRGMCQDPQEVICPLFFSGKFYTFILRIKSLTVGKLMTDFLYGQQFPHQWNQIFTKLLTDYFIVVNYFPTVRGSGT